jgi:pimeloyl-ACP methyl ester carboxylesterase
MTKIAVYCMPGLAASTDIFERIELPADVFEMILLEWKIPLKDETLAAYAQRMVLEIKHDHPVLVGVSFGGILVQEMATFCNARKVIILSSVKTNLEFPRRMKIAKAIKLYKILPTSVVSHFETLAKISLGDKINQRLKLYEKYLSIRDKSYLDWALKSVLLWDREVADASVVHIHGDKDEVFPIKNITNAIVVKGGTHILVLNKYKWLNENLPKLILEDSGVD